MPTYRELGAKVGIRSPTGVVVQLDALTRKGWLERWDALSRGIVVPELADALRAAARAMLDKGAA